MRPNTLRTLRRYHLYLGLFFAPMILLFSVSGALQTFRLTEARGYGGTPPTWMVWLASVHKDQGPPRVAKREKPQGGVTASDQYDHDHASDHDRADAAKGAAKRPDTLPLKIFVVVLAVALALSTTMGIVIATANSATRRVSLILLALGTAVPIFLLWI